MNTIKSTLPDPLDGYRYLEPDEEPRHGDYAYNFISNKWELLRIETIATAKIFGNHIYRVPPTRKLGEL